MPLKNEPIAKTKDECAKCHREPFQRMLHLLRNFFSDHLAELHLKQEFGEAREKDGFIKSELIWRQFILKNYSKQLDEEARQMPVWLAFARSKCIVTKTPTGWHMKPRPRRDPTPDEIRANRKHYVQTGEISPSCLGGWYANMKPYRPFGDVDSIRKHVEFDRPYEIREVPCFKCGQIFKLPFANGNEQTVLCEDCNRKERK